MVTSLLLTADFKERNTKRYHVHTLFVLAAPSDLTMKSGSSYPEPKGQPESNAGACLRLRCDVICLSKTDRWRNVHHRRCTNWFIAFVVIIASLQSFYRVQKYELSELITASTIFNEEIQLYGPEGWSDVKLLVYMTTHLSQTHIEFLPCWKDAIERLGIFKYADLMLYTASEPTNEQLEMLPFRNVMIKMYANPGYHDGAVQALVDPFLDKNTWFDDYDWVMRVNPDVLIRKDEWLMQTMLNTSIDMIVHDCVSTNKHTENAFLHTDFFAFRPPAIDRERLLHADRGYAEGHFTHTVRPIFDAGRFAYVEGGKNAMDGYCRIEGVGSPVLHVHELYRFCPYYYNITKEGFYR